MSASPEPASPALPDAAARRVVLHAGMPKTGTSALQVALVQNREVLADLGVHYPLAKSDDRARKGEITSGNADALQRFLTGEAGLEAAARTALRSGLSGGLPVTLFSSELLFYASRQPLSSLRVWAQEAGATLEVALFVRDAVPQQLSPWMQYVKRRKYEGDFDTFLASLSARQSRWRTQLEMFTAELGESRVRVMHYESHCRALLQQLVVEGLAVEMPTDSHAFVEPGMVNRSLTAHEVEWMRLVNRLLDDQRVSTTVSDILVGRAPADGTPVTLSAPQVEALSAHFREDVAWINHRFFDGQALLSSAGTASGSDTSGPPEMSPREAQLVEVFTEALNGVWARSTDLRAQLAAERARTRRAQRRARNLSRRLADQPPSPPKLRARLRRRLGRLVRA